MSVYPEFRRAVASGRFDDALALFLGKSRDEQRSILSEMAGDLGFLSCRANKEPTALAVLYRELHEGKTFADFHGAWKPPAPRLKAIGRQEVFAYFSQPVRVINAQNVADPREIVSIGMIWSESEAAVARELEDRAETEAQRHERISEVADKTRENAFYRVMSDDILGGLGT